MLHTKNGGGDKKSHLRSSLHRFEGRPQGHLGLAVAHIAAKKPIHGTVLFHIPLHILGGRKLAFRLLILKGVFKFPLHLIVLRKSNSGTAHPFGIQGNQLFGHVLGGGLCFILGLFPIGSAHAGELQTAVLCAFADILGNLVQLFTRQIKHIGSGIADLEKIPPYALHRQGGHPHILPDPVGFVHYKITHRKISIG